MSPRALILILATFIGLFQVAYADDELVITDVTMTKVELSDEAKQIEAYLYLNNLMDPSIGEIIAIGEKLIAFGTKIWKIIEDGKPSATVAMAKPISILPLTKTDDMAFYDMEGWSAPNVSTYRFEAKNIYGRVLASFAYNVAFQSNGSYLGTGKYITGLQVNASSVFVKWGVAFNASSELMMISNRGTEDDPIAGATIKVDYDFKTTFSELRKSASFHVAGNGELVAY